MELESLLPYAQRSAIKILPDPYDSTAWQPTLFQIENNLHA